MIIVTLVSLACVVLALVTTTRILLADDQRITARIALVLFYGWLALAIFLGHHGFYAAPTLPPRLGIGVTVPFGLVMLALLIPSFRRLVDSVPLAWLVRAQLFRVVGLALLVGYAVGVLPARFALTAGIGDIVTGLAAPWVAGQLAQNRPHARAIALTWSVFGFLDLVDAVALGVLSAPTPIRHFFAGPSTAAMAVLPLVLLPAFIVPLGLSLHVFAFRRLRKS
jgi:hypothetical protein